MANFPKNPQGVLNQAKNDRTERESTWDKINLFLRGVQWLRPWNRGDKGWTTLDAEGSNRLFVTVNKMLPYLRSAMARMVLMYPGAAVVPASDSYEDIAKALTSGQVLRHWWNEANLAMVGFEMGRYLVTYGSCALHTYYEPGPGEDPKNIKGEGSVRVEAISPYNFFLEPGADCLEESEYVILRSFVTKSELRKDYKGKDLSNITPSDREKGNVKRSKERNTNRYEKLEWYYKDGGYGVSVGDKWLFRMQKHHSPDFFPIEIPYYTKLDDAPYGMGIMEPLTQLQWLYNKSRTRTARNLEKLGHGKVFVPLGSEVKKSDWDDTSGGFVPYNEAGGKPWVWTPNVNVTQEIDQAMRVQAEMDDVAGIHSVSRGKQVPGMRSGKAIEALAETDSSDTIMTVFLVEEAMRGVFRCALYFMKKYYKKDRQIKTWDGYGDTVYKTLQNTMLVKTPDVFIEPGSMFRDNADKRRAEVLEFLERQIITPDEAIEMLGDRVGMNQRLMEKLQALRNSLDAVEHMKQGGVIRLFAFENLKVFRKVLLEEMNKPEFKDLHEKVQWYFGNTLARIDTHGMGAEELERAQGLQDVMAERQAAPNPGGNPLGITGPKPQAAAGMAGSAAETEGAEAALLRRQNASPLNRGF